MFFPKIGLFIERTVLFLAIKPTFLGLKREIRQNIRENTVLRAENLNLTKMPDFARKRVFSSKNGPETFLDRK